MNSKSKKLGPAQQLVLNYLRSVPNGEMGAVRTNQRARQATALREGTYCEWQCGSSDCLAPLYRLVELGLVRVEPTGRKAFGSPVMRYFAA